MSKRPLSDQLDQAIDGIIANPGAELPSADPALLELLRLARDLRGLPDPDFKARLKAELEREPVMSTTTVEFRQGFRTVTPYLLAPDAPYMDFLERTFDAEETERTESGPGRFHAEVRVGDSMLMVGVGSGRSMPAGLIVYVKNADETYERALAAGATASAAIVEAFGDRFGVVQDVAGNSWCIATFLGGQSIGQEHLKAVTMIFSVRGAAQFIDFLKQAFAAEEVVRYGAPDGPVVHAKLRIGNSVIALGEAHGDRQPKASMVYMYVPDCDALYAQALRAGARSISQPADQTYGDRHGAVEDAWGNQWYIATPLGLL